MFGSAVACGGGCYATLRYLLMYTTAVHYEARNVIPE